MVTTDVTQLAGECNTWRMKLRSHRDQLSRLNNSLQDLAAKQHSRQILQDVEHFHNQFHIQLINVHDLKHSIKDHEKIADWEMGRMEGQCSDATWAAHEDLYDQYQQLDHTLDELKKDYENFSGRLKK